jgi:competence ComEA-like helix-hairpin-helix protein
MLVLTRSERRAGLVVIVLLLLGAGHDLWRSRHPRLEVWREPRRGPQSAPAPDARVLDRDAPPVAEGRLPVAQRMAGETGVGPRALDLNRASPIELDQLPGVGPVLAARIVEHRNRNGRFRRVDELLAVRGIGPRLIERLRQHVTVSDSASGRLP